MKHKHGLALSARNGTCLHQSLETTSPRDRAVLVRERARRAVRVEEREPHGLTCGLFDRARTLEVVEVRRGEARARSVDLDAVDSRSEAKASVIALSAAFDEE